MFTDMVGYTALTQANESLAMEVLDRHNRLLRPIFPRFRGREVKAIGDSFLVEFDSALDALRCAVEIQLFLHDYNLSSKEEWKINLRIGLHLGDVVHQNGDVFGDAVNIASRIEPIAEPEGICVSGEVYAQVQNKIGANMVSLGEKALKNVTRPVLVYKVEMPWDKGTVPQEGGLDRRRVAVMPLVNMISDPSEVYFADGMTEELISAISRIHELKVISRTSAMHYKNQSKRVTEIGKELGAGTVLEGSVRKAGNRVRIAVQLIDAGSDQHLWAENYDRTLEDVFEVQGDIASKVAGELRVQLVDSEKRGLEEKATGSVEAYTSFLRGRDLLHQDREASVRQAVGFFERAIELDPLYAGAYWGLASCYQWLGNRGYEPYQDSVTKAKAPLNKALELDPNLAEAHAAMALVALNEDRLAVTEAESRRAIELNSSITEAYWMLANVAMTKLETGEVIRLVEICYRLDPLRPDYVSAHGEALFLSGREAEALEFCKDTERYAPEGTYRNVAEHYLFKGDLQKAEEFRAKVERLEPNSRWNVWMKGFIAARMGDKLAALNAIEKMEAKGTGVSVDAVVSYVRYALGDLDGFFDGINRALAKHEAPSLVLYSPLFAEARADPRFQAYLEKSWKMYWPEGR